LTDDVVDNNDDVINLTGDDDNESPLQYSRESRDQASTLSVADVAESVECL
jgi:hypothetical protein